jgi:hypothetical protein
MLFQRHPEASADVDQCAENRGGGTKVSSPALIGMSLRQDIPGGLLSSRVRFRFSCQDHSETEESRCQEKCSEWRSVPFGRVSKLDTVHLSVPSLLRPVWFPFAAAPHPAGTGRASIRRSMLPNSRRVRWLSASSSR